MWRYQVPRYGVLKKLAAESEGGFYFIILLFCQIEQVFVKKGIQFIHDPSLEGFVVRIE